MPNLPNHVAKAARRGWMVVALAVTWAVLYFAARIILERSTGLSGGARLALALAPTPVYAAFLWQLIALLRSADELERRIQLEALAVAFPLGLLLLTTLALTQRAVALNPENWSYSHIWPYFILFYIAGLALARRRYA